MATNSPSRMETLRKSLGTLKTPLSPKLRRRRHSSGGADSDDSLSVSQAETVSDHSDVEIRLHTLQDELQRRMTTAARLKKQVRDRGIDRNGATLFKLISYFHVKNDVRRHTFVNFLKHSLQL